MSTFQHTIADTGTSTGTSLSSITFFMEALSFLNGLQAHVSVYTSYLSSGILSRRQSCLSGSSESVSTANLKENSQLYVPHAQVILSSAGIRFSMLC